MSQPIKCFFVEDTGRETEWRDLPGGDWVVDSQSSNCAMPDDFKQERHHCWIIEGSLPDITVSKRGVTCEAGAGSIQCGSYHGFLRNGFLEEC